MVRHCLNRRLAIISLQSSNDLPVFDQSLSGRPADQLHSVVEFANLESQERISRPLRYRAMELKIELLTGLDKFGGI